MKPADFIAKILPAARALMAETGIPASVTIAQAAVESANPARGWGDSDLTRASNNLFGIKAGPGWHGPVFSADTAEFDHGQRAVVHALWRKYPDWQASLEDHARFLRANPRYAACFKETTGEGWARALQAAGYSTNPGYADLLIQIMRGRNMEQYDK